MRIMQKIFQTMVAVFLAFSIIGCQSELRLKDSIDLYKFNESYASPDMEFIGFKAGDSQWGNSSRADWSSIKNSQAIRSIGSSLQFGGIAIDESNSYFGVYSFQEIKEYKNKKRFITFIEFPDFDLTYSQGVEPVALFTIGAVLSSLVVGLPLGLIFMAASNYKTHMYLNASANIYVYDSKIGEIVYKKNVYFKEEKVFTGLWSESSEIGRQKVHDYFATEMANRLLEEYDNLKDTPLLKK